MESQQPLDAFGATEPDDSDEFERADGVYRWTPAEATCDRCGDESAHLWRDGMRSVCPACKEW